jgi:hypothetical protein
MSKNFEGVEELSAVRASDVANNGANVIRMAGN